MTKFNAKNLVITVFLGIFLVGITGIVNAQQTLPGGGENFETAVKLELGSYQRDTLEENEYFYIADIKPGQNLDVKYTFGTGTSNDGWGTLGLYNENKVKIWSEWDTVGKGELKLIAVSWLLNADEGSYKYYIRAGYDNYDVGPITLVVSLTDNYDAGTQTDAGDSFEKAMSINPGEYTAYLSGEEKGEDVKDFYKLTVEKDKTLTVTVTPQAESRMQVIIYDSRRQVIKNVYAPNPSAIVENSISIIKKGDFFVSISPQYYSGDPFAYALSIKTETGVEAASEGEGEGEWVLPGESIGWPTEGGLTKKTVEKAAKGFFMVVIIPALIGLIVLIVIIVVIVILIRRKKKQ